jgi:GNAT superfamily N-acetyltransferase
MQPTARLATTDDIGEVVRLRRVLFESLDEVGNEWETPCAVVLEKALSEGWMIVAVVDAPDGGGLAAAGSAEVQQRLPGPSNVSGQLGYIGTMATDPRWRRRGFARAVLAAVLDELADRSVTRIELHATPAAETLYRSAGFAERPGGLEMQLLYA